MAETRTKTNDNERIRMVGIHKTKEGDTMQIAEMDDAHLMNSIICFCRQIKQLRLILDGETEIKSSTVALMGNNRVSHDKVAKEYRKRTTGIMPYVMEATLRCIPDIHVILQDTFDRRAALTKTPLIEADDDCDEYDEYDEWERIDRQF